MEKKVRKTLSCVDSMREEGTDTLPGVTMAASRELFNTLFEFLDNSADYRYQQSPHWQRLRDVEGSLLDNTDDVSALAGHYKFLEER